MAKARSRRRPNPFSIDQRWVKWTAGLVALAIAYPLSFGPVLWLGTLGLVPEVLGGVILVFYLPLAIAADSHWILSALLVEYVSWWV